MNFMAMNRGEWSELYAILHLLVNPKLKLVDENLNFITDKIYTIENLSINQNHHDLKYIIDNKGDIEVYFDTVFMSTVERLEIYENKIGLLDAIKSNTKRKGAFEILSSESILNKITINNKIKSSSEFKKDIESSVYDSISKCTQDLSYSVKSSLGSPATILNSSSQTNFVFEVANLDLENIDIINNIKTRKKLKDRIEKIHDLGGDISFLTVSSSSFDYNLKMIDTKMPEYIANTLLNSYIKDNKKLKELFLSSNDFPDENFALKKLGDLLCAISFGFFPGKQWNGINEVNGGLIIVKKDGNVVIIDLVYYTEMVRKYLIENTKLDSPSSSRYKMLDLYTENDKIYFTLNLQIRYAS